MGRGKSYKEIDFLRALPEGETNALTTQEIADKVGCSYSLTSKMLRELHGKGEIFMGRSGDFGRFTYYMAQKRPEISLPVIKDARGVGRPLTWWLTHIKENNEVYINNPSNYAYGRIIFPTILQLTLSAIGYNNAIPFEEAWAQAQQHIRKMEAALNALRAANEGFKYDPLLNDGKETREEVAATIRALFHDTGLVEEELLTLAQRWNY